VRAFTSSLKKKVRRCACIRRKMCLYSKRSVLVSKEVCSYHCPKYITYLFSLMWMIHFFFFLFIVVLFCLSSLIVLKFAFDFILIFFKNFCRINCITCARQDTRSTLRTFNSTSTNIRLIRNKWFNFVCMIKLLKAFSFVTTYKCSFNSCRTTTSCTIFVNFCSMWKFEICSKTSKTSW
jgi:hypothetical protein